MRANDHDSNDHDSNDHDSNDHDIIVGIDGSAGSDAALAYAFGEARRRGVGVRAITAYDLPSHLITHYSRWPASSFDHALDEFRVAVEQDVTDHVDLVRAELRAEWNVDALPTSTVSAVCAPAVLTLLDAAQGETLVVGRRGHGRFASLVLGSVSVQCLLNATGPVTVVPPGYRSGDHPEGVVVVGVDRSPDSRAACAFAMCDAARRGTTLRVISGFDLDELAAAVTRAPLPMNAADLARNVRHDAQTMVEEVAAGLAGSCAAATVEVTARPGPPAELLLDAAEKADLLVVGHRGRSPLASFILGSVALRCVLHAPCPVSVVPSTATG